MAIQVGPLFLEGSVEGLSFYRVEEERRVRRTGRVSRRRLKFSAAYERTRENNAEFGAASDVAGFILKALKGETKKVSDRSKLFQLSGQLVHVIRSDKKNRRGERNILDADLTLLAGFEFTKHASLHDILKADYTTWMSRSRGELTVKVKPFTPCEQVSAPPHATHFQLTATATAIDFRAGEIVAQSSGSAFIEVSSPEAIALTLVNTLPRSKNPWFLLLGIQFFRLVRGKMKPLRKRENNALAIVKVNTETEVANVPMGLDAQDVSMGQECVEADTSRFVSTVWCFVDMKRLAVHNKEDSGVLDFEAGGFP